MQEQLNEPSKESFYITRETLETPELFEPKFGLFYRSDCQYRIFMAGYPNQTELSHEKSLLYCLRNIPSCKKTQLLGSVLDSPTPCTRKVSAVGLFFYSRQLESCDAFVLSILYECRK